MIYVVIDTNVFVAALLSRHPDSATVLVVNTLMSRGICPLFLWMVCLKAYQIIKSVLCQRDGFDICALIKVSNNRFYKQNT